MLLLLFAVVTGITLLNITEDSKPTASMLGDSVIESEVKKEVKKEIIPESVTEEIIEAEVKKEVKKEIIPESVTEEIIEAEVKKEVKKEIIPESVIEEAIEPVAKTDSPEQKSVPKAIGAISEISQPSDKYYLIVASFLDNDLAFDYAKKLILSESNVIIIQPFNTSKFTRVALEYETLDNEIFFIPTRKIFLKVKDDEIISNIGLDKYKDEFDEQLWVLKY